MDIEVIALRAFRDNYIWCLRNATHAVVVDPGDAAPVLDYLASERLELAADALAQAHSALGDIGGRLSADGLLGHIFSSFCIGK